VLVAHVVYATPTSVAILGGTDTRVAYFHVIVAKRGGSAPVNPSYEAGLRVSQGIELVTMSHWNAMRLGTSGGPLADDEIDLLSARERLR
jgi:hypothetical protein